MPSNGHLTRLSKSPLASVTAGLPRLTGCHDCSTEPSGGENNSLDGTAERTTVSEVISPHTRRTGLRHPALLDPRGASLHRGGLQGRVLC